MMFLVARLICISQLCLVVDVFAIRSFGNKPCFTRVRLHISNPLTHLGRSVSSSHSMTLSSRMKMHGLDALDLKMLSFVWLTWQFGSLDIEIILLVFPWLNYIFISYFQCLLIIEKLFVLFLIQIFFLRLHTFAL